jgi:hypothetical protein
MKINNEKVEMSDRDKNILKNGDFGQGEFLVSAKNKRNGNEKKAESKDKK